MKKIIIAILILFPSFCFSQNKMWGSGGFNTNSYYWYLVNSTDSLVSQRGDSTVFYKPTRVAAEQLLMPTVFFGIGANTPLTKLHITGDATNEALLRITPNANANQVGIEFTTTTSSTIIGSIKTQASSGEMRFFTTSSYFPTFYSNNAEVMRINTSGNVGIGTTSPASSTLLHVASTTKGVLLAPMTDTQMNAISSPTEGTLVYDLTNHLYKFWNGTAWTAL